MAAETSSSMASGASSSPASRPSACAQQLVEVALDAGGVDGGGGLGGEDAEQLHVPQRERRRGALVEQLQDADGPGAPLVDQRHGSDGARHVARPLRRCPVEARVAHDVGEGEWLAGREDEAGDAFRGRHREADGTRALLAGGDAELEAIRVALEDGDRCRLGIEERDRGIDDRLQERGLRVALHAPRDAGSLCRRAQDLERRLRRGLVRHAQRSARRASLSTLVMTRVSRSMRMRSSSTSPLSSLLTL